MSKPFWSSALRWPSSSERPSSIAPGRNDSAESSTTETAKPKGSARSPSLYLSLGFLFLGISGFLSLEEPEAQDKEVRFLQHKGWKAADRLPCGEGRPGYYELEGEAGALEFYVSRKGEVLVPRESSWPEAPLACRPITHPSFVEEI